VLSYLALGGKCSACKAPISPRYPAVELCHGAAVGLPGLAFRQRLDRAWRAGVRLPADRHDLHRLDTQLLPDDLTYPLLWLGLLVNLHGTFVPLRDAVIGAAAGYLALWSVYWLFKLVTGKEGMGYGDFKLLAALGAWLGWRCCRPSSCCPRSSARSSASA
jgi:leader peptidase (prepilin peptidase)/N-methyltransferase